mgnify:CR=1 FL=1
MVSVVVHIRFAHRNLLKDRAAILFIIDALY